MRADLQNNCLDHSPGPARAYVAARRKRQPESSRDTAAELLGADPRGEFLAMVLHELQDPLGAIVAGVAFVRDTDGMPPQSQWLWAGLENATRQGRKLLGGLVEPWRGDH